MKYLDLNDLEFSPLDYKSKGAGLRKWFLTSLEFNPVSFLKISKEVGINYRVLLSFSRSKSKYMSYRNMSLLKDYVKSLMADSVNMEDVKDEEFFEG